MNSLLWSSMRILSAGLEKMFISLEPQFQNVWFPSEPQDKLQIFQWIPSENTSFPWNQIPKFHIFSTPAWVVYNTLKVDALKNLLHDFLYCRVPLTNDDFRKMLMTPGPGSKQQQSDAVRQSRKEWVLIISFIHIILFDIKMNYAKFTSIAPINCKQYSCPIISIVGRKRSRPGLYVLLNTWF